MLTSGSTARYGTPRNGLQPSAATGRSSRFGTPIRHGFGSDRGDSPSKYMDVDSGGFSVDKGRMAEESRVFALSDTLSVRLAASLPIEVQQVFQASDPSKDVFTGSIDISNGSIKYGVVVSVQTCFVWRIDLYSPSHIPTCYLFPVPPLDPSKDNSRHLTLPFASLVPFGASREPGLILVSSSGKILFWDSIATGLSGAERFTTSEISLAENETVHGLERVDAMVYTAMTKSRIYRLTVTSRPGTGKFTIVSRPFNDVDYRTSSWLTPFRLLKRRNGPWDNGEIITVAPSPQDRISINTKEGVAYRSEERLIWVLTNRCLLQWSVRLAGDEQCLHNYEVRDVVADAILNGIERDRSKLDIEFLDVTVDASGDPVLLISHGPISESNSSPLDIDMAPVRIYALVRLQPLPNSEVLRVKGNVEVLPYELAADPSHALTPHLRILPSLTQDEDLEISFTQFSDAFAFTALKPPYQEQLHLKNVFDMILGFNTVDHSDGHEVLLLTTGMLLAARPNSSNILKMMDDIHTGRANVLKSTIRQAMKYGIKPENPLRFQLSSIADGESLKVAAEQMSHAFLISDPDVVIPSLSLGVQLASRESSLEALVMFIGESGGLGKLSYSTREHLLADAEKLAAARGLWAYHNEQAQKSTASNLLPLTIDVYMKCLGQMTDDDTMRTFFNTQIPQLGSLLPEMLEIVRAEYASQEARQADPYLLIHANGLNQALFSAAFKYRAQHRAQYQLSGAVIQPWTSVPSLLQNLRQLFELTSSKLRIQSNASFQDPENVFIRQSVREDLLLQLRELASYLFRAYSDRLDYMNSRSQDGNVSERERNRLEEEFHSLRPQILNQLVQVGSIDYAFKLAETYRDFHALSELSYHASADKTILASDRIRKYIHRFQGDFTSQLYKWYIEHGKLKLLFDQETEYGDFLDNFFSENSVLRLSWIHDVEKKAYQRAASTLFEVSEIESNQETRQLILSIGKLATMADGPAATPPEKLKAFNNSLDFMAIHRNLLQEFTTDLGDPSSFAIESQARALTSAKCTAPADCPALQELFQRILKQLLQGDVLTEEDAADLMSMKSNTESPMDFVEALTILSKSGKQLSENCKTVAIRNVWRRIYLHDNWGQIRAIANRTDYELHAQLRNTQLYQILTSSALPYNCIAHPSEALQIPTQAEMELRWPGMAPNQIQELLRDFACESRALSEHGPKDHEFSQVRSLLEENVKGGF